MIVLNLMTFDYYLKIFVKVQLIIKQLKKTVHGVKTAAIFVGIFSNILQI